MRYSQIKQALREAEIIDEVSMSPTALQRFANSPEAEGMLMGIEFEMCVPNAATDDDGGGEYDYDQNQSAYSIEEIINFFRNGEYSSMGRSEADRLSGQMWDQFLEWQSGQIWENIDDNELNSRIRDRLESDYTVNDYVDVAREELGDDAPDDDVQGRAEELRDDAITEIIDSADGRDYQYAYDSAREELEDEMRDDSDYDQEAWLSDIGVNDMQDAEREWSLDWPHMTYGGGGDLSVDDVGDEFAQAMGLESVNTSSNYHGARRDGVRWIIEPDSSIDADEGDGGLEFVSPPMPIKTGLEMLEKMYAWAKKNGCYTNKSTGLHMNISVPDMSIDNLDYVKLALFLGDEYVLREFDRQYNSYAKSAMSIVKEKIQQNPENATALLAKMKEHLNAAASKLVHTGITNKYTSINTKSNYVEFRGPGGDYLNQDLSKLTSTVLRLAQSLRIATDENAYKQEYAKKLYKLVGPKEGEWTDPNNSVALFSRYALGQINKEELVSNVRQAQIARKEKKGDEVQYWVMNKDGSGGKQMVFAAGETAAIILGGKQMGMTREESIRKLRAELFVDKDAMPESTPRYWQEWLQDQLPTVTVDTINQVRSNVVSNNYNLAQDVTAWVVKQIDDELRRRMNTPPAITDMPESMPEPWKRYLRDNAPRALASDLRDSIRFIDRGDRDDQLDTANKAFVRNYLERLIRWKEQGDAGSGVVDGNETRWKVYFARGEYAERPIDAVFVDADSPRQAKLKAAELFSRELGVVTLDISDLEATATTQDAGSEAAVELPTTWALFVNNITNYEDDALTNTKRELLVGHMDDQLNMAQVADLLEKISAEQRRRSRSSDTLSSLSQAWQTWLGQVGTHASETLENMLDTIDAGTGDVERMTPDQRNLIIITINQELRSRQTTNYNDLAANARRAENDVRASLPQSHREFLDDLANKSDMGLINILRNNNVYQGVSEQAAAYFRVQLKHELRRRGINPDSESDATPAQRPGLGQSTYSVEHIPTGQVTQVIGNDAADAIERQATATGGQQSNFRIAQATNTQPADQQNQLRRDDPVTSNDPEADSPYIAQTTATDFEVVKRDGTVVTRISGGDMVYAHRQAREFEQYLGLEGGELSVRAVPAQTNESIKELRRLAGLK